MSQFRTLARWSKVMGPVSLLHAIRLLRAGRHGGDTRIDDARPLRARNCPITIFARPGTDDLFVFLEIFLEGEYRRAAELVSAPVRTVLDLGSNVGCSIAYFSAIFPDARFIGVEPSKHNLAAARRSLRPLLDKSRVILTNAFVGARPRSAFLGRGGSGGSNELFLNDDSSAEASSERIDVITVPQLIEQHKIDTIDLLKCDIEGGEHELFSDCGPWIGKVRSIVIELHNGLDGAWLVGQLHSAGAEFELQHVDQKGPGVCVAWLNVRLNRR